MPPPEIDPEQRSLLHRLSPQLKLAAALLIAVGTALMPRRLDALYIVPALLVLGMWVIAGMPLAQFGRRLLLAEPFILGVAILSLMNPGAAPIFLSAVVKSHLCIFTLLLLTWTTPFHEILQVLRRVRVPAVLLTTLALMVRYLPVLAEESKRMQRARASRTFSRRGPALWRNLTAILGQLFIRSVDRAERIYLAMCARGWK